MMNSRNEMDAFIMFMRALKGDTIEQMEQDGNERAARNIQVAKDMTPAKEEWEKIGFKFTEIPGDDVLYQAELPEGWTMRTTSLYCSEIVDQNGNVRASMFYKSSFYDRNASMYLTARYRVATYYTELEDGATTEIYFGNEQEKLYVAGEVFRKNEMTDEERKIAREKEIEYTLKAEAYASEYYPNYQDVTAYWNDENNKQIKLK